MGVTYNSMINAHVGAKDVDKAERWFTWMQKGGLKPNEVTYNSMINAHIGAEDVDKAERWFTWMQEAGLKPGKVTYNSMINAHVGAEDVDKAERWFTWMQKAGLKPDEVTYTSMINAHIGAKDVGKAERWFTRMQEAGLKPNEVTYTSMIHCAANVGDLLAAKQWLLRMEQNGFRSSVVGYTALLQSMQGDWQEIMRTLAQWRTKGLMLDRAGYDVAATLLVQCGRHESAINLIHEAVRLGIYKAYFYEDGCVDLHYMSVEVAKVVLTGLLNDMLERPFKLQLHYFDVCGAMTRGISALIGLMFT